MVGPAWKIVRETAVVAFRYRAPGLAAEAAFFTLLSIPPLIVALVAGAGFVADWLQPVTLSGLRDGLETWALRLFAAETVHEVIMPTYDDTLRGGRTDMLSLGGLIALWSGSRALHIFLDTISIMYGQGGARGPVMARIMSLTAYVIAAVVMSVTVPLLLIGPTYLRAWLPGELDLLVQLYWPMVGVLGILSLTGLFHVATPERSPYWRDLPGALFTVVLWVGGSMVIRLWAQGASGGTSVFGPLTAPIILMVYLWFIALAVLLGASLNAGLRRLWPPPEYRGPRARLAEGRQRRRAAAAERRAERARVRGSHEAPDDEDEERQIRAMDGMPGPH